MSYSSFQVRNSAQLWVLEAQTGVLCHDGEIGDIINYTIKEGDTLVLEYDSVNKTLAFGLNDQVGVA